MSKSIFMIMNKWYVSSSLSPGWLLQVLVVNKGVSQAVQTKGIWRQRSLYKGRKAEHVSGFLLLWPGARWGRDWWKTPSGPECQCVGRALGHSPWPKRTAGCRRLRSASTEFPRNGCWSQGWAPLRNYSTRWRKKILYVIRLWDMIFEPLFVRPLCVCSVFQIGQMESFILCRQQRQHRWNKVESTCSFHYMDCEFWIKLEGTALGMSAWVANLNATAV